MAARAGAFFIGMSLRRWSMSRGISLRAGKVSNTAAAVRCCRDNSCGFGAGASMPLRVALPVAHVAEWVVAPLLLV